MSELVDRTITALRAEHDALVALLGTIGDGEGLSAPSGADQWTIAQVYSHLGSGAEIGRAPIARAAGEQVRAEDNQTIWARWDAALCWGLRMLLMLAVDTGRNEVPMGVPW